LWGITKLSFTSTCKQNICSVLLIAGVIISNSNRVFAQITPDETLPNNSNVRLDGNITGGTQEGSNLFHSFKEFSVSTGSSAKFDNIVEIKNIITRVTGNNISNIDGLIKANGEANVFLLNPNGIIFGTNAQLEIGGSFVASTANSVKFADGKEFSATPREGSPLLTVSVPVGLQFGVNPGDIRSQGSFMRVLPEKTLALVGSNLALQGSSLEGGRIELGSVAPATLVQLNQPENGYVLGYTGVKDFKDINISQGAFILSVGGADVKLQGRNVTLKEKSQIESLTEDPRQGGDIVVNANNLNVEDVSVITTATRDKGTAGNIIVNASESVELIGLTPDSPGGIFSQADAGNGGNIIIETEQLLIKDGAAVDVSNFGAGQAGNVKITAGNSITLIGSSSDSNLKGTTGIFAQVAEVTSDNIEKLGNAGNIDIKTGKLTVLDGAQISSSARKTGNGGNITIEANSIKLRGTLPNANLTKGSSGIFVTAEPRDRKTGIVTTGKAGNLQINTNRGAVTVENGAKISANNYGTGEGGSLNLNVGQLLIQNGGLVTSSSFDGAKGGNIDITASDVQVIGKGNIGLISVESALLTEATFTPNQDNSNNLTLVNNNAIAGNLNINANSLTVKDSANISVSNKYQSGRAGNLTIQTQSITLDNQASLIGTTESGNGGDITMSQLGLLDMRRASLISTTAGNNNNPGNGGNITIDAPNGFIVATPLQNNDITANAFVGKGGKITINATSLFGIELRDTQEDPLTLPTNDITAISIQDPSLSGVVQINTPDVDPSSGLVELPTNLVDIARQIATACTPQDENRQNSFIVTGRGGLAESPTEGLQDFSIITEWVERPQQEQKKPGKFSLSVSTQRSIVEASGWMVDASGKIHLVATNTPINSQSLWQNSRPCY
jgi:filamentous hemagglutinin family protein